LPDGLSGNSAVQSSLEKYSAFPVAKISTRLEPAPSRPIEGRIAIVTVAGRDAMDAAALDV
jgi:hypothetical protein